MLLALISLFRGLEHVDVRRFERHLRFMPSTLVEALPQAVVTLAAWPVAYWLGDYRAVLVLLLAKGLASCVSSHVVAERRYRWRIQTEYIRRIMAFGWPLLVNGVLLFGVLQGEQFFVASFYSMKDLAPYAAASALATAPGFLFGRVFNSVALPVLASVQDDPPAFAKRYRQVLTAIGLFSVGSGFGLILGGEALMRLVYGAKYAGSGVLLGWLAAANAFRTLRTAPALAALAKGDSQNQMISNFGRVASLAPAFFFALTRQPLWLIACTGLLGEAVASWISILRLKRRDGVPLSTSVGAVAWVILPVGTAGLLAFAGFYRLPPFVGLALAALGAGAGGVAMIAATPELRSEALGLYASRRWAGWRSFFNDGRIRSAGKAAGA
jgi:O-antigen/teichoic acid export membrane protein